MNIKGIFQNLMMVSGLSVVLMSSQTSYADTTTQSYQAANAPGIHSCTKGYDLLSGEEYYSKQLIKGALPYTIIYQGQVRSNGWNAYNYLEPMQSAGGWSDNYTNYVAYIPFAGGYSVDSQGNVSLSYFYIVKLPGVEQQYVFKKTETTYENGGNITTQMYRIYDGIDPISKQGVAATGTLPTTNTTQFGDINFSIDPNTNNITVIRNGITYVATTTQSSAWDGTYYSRFSSVNYPNGTQLTLAYDNNLNLATVKDNRNHLLTLAHSPSQTVQLNTQLANAQIALQSPVSDVKLTTPSFAGFGTGNDTQEVTLSYDTYDSEDMLNHPIRRYVLRSVTNNALNNGVALATFSYQAYLTGGMSFLVQETGTSSSPSIATYGFPILSQVNNEAGLPERGWEYSGQSYIYNASAQVLTTSQTTINAAVFPSTATVTTAPVWQTSTTYEDDVRNKITMSFAPDGQNTQNTTISITTPTTTSMTMSISGFPCLSDGAHPLSAVSFDTGNSRITSTTDNNNNQTNYTYNDPLERLSQTVEAASNASLARTTSYAYTTLSDNQTANNTPIPNTITAPEVTVNNVINLRGQLQQQTRTYPKQSGSEQPQVWINQYYETSDNIPTSYGLLKYTRQPRDSAGGFNESTWHSYDTYGNLSSSWTWVGVSNPTQRTTTYTNYNSAGLPQNISYPDGAADTIVYDGGYQVKSKAHSNGTVTQNTSNTYDAFERLATSTDADGYTTTYNYDNIGRQNQVIYPNGNQTLTSYFPNNVTNVVNNTSSSGSVVSSTTQTLDSSGRVYSSLQGSNTGQLWTQFTYDANNNVTQTQTAAGIINKWSYDALNRVSNHTDGKGNIDTKAYDDADNNTNENAANGAGDTNYFKNNTLLQSVVNSDTGTINHYNDFDNNIVEIQHLDRQCAYGTIDQLGRQQYNNCTSSSSNSELLLNDIYTYDQNGQSDYGNLDSSTTNISGQGTNTSYTYDGFHRVLSKTQVNNTPASWGYTASHQTVSYTYTAAGRPSTTTYPSGNVVSYQYSGSGQPLSVELNGIYVISGIVFDGASRLHAWTWGSHFGVFHINYNTDDTDLIGSITSTNLSGQTDFSATYGYDTDGRITSQAVADTSTNGTATYGYDNDSQLTSEGMFNGAGLTYTYDNNGNRTSLRESGNPGFGYTQEDYTYSSGSNRFTGWFQNGGGALTLGYTNQGELYNSYKGAATYDGAGRRRTETGVPGSTIYTGQYFDYNHKNERTFRGGSYIDRQYAYDEQSHLIGEYDANGNTIVEYIWLGDRPIAAVYPGSPVVYLVTDNQNKPRRGINNSTQATVWAWDPDAFGVTQPTGSVTVNLRFPGQYYDIQSGLYYNHNRYYNPEIGRYMEPDPTGLEAGLNPYEYAGNDPVNNVDPTGLDYTSDSIAYYQGLYAQDFASYAAGGLSYDQFTRNAQTYGTDIANLSSQYVNLSNIATAGLIVGTDGLVASATEEAGSLNILEGANPSADELRAGQGLADMGHDVQFLPTASSQGIQGVRTADMTVNGTPIDIYTPTTTDLDSITRNIVRKNTQADGVLIQSTISNSDATSIANRVFGNPRASNMNILYFQDASGQIIQFKR